MRSFLYVYKNSACIFSHISISRVNNTMNRNFPSLFLSFMFVVYFHNWQAILCFRWKFNLFPEQHTSLPNHPNHHFFRVLYLFLEGELPGCVVFTSFCFHRTSKSNLPFLKITVTTISYVLSSKGSSYAIQVYLHNFLPKGQLCSFSQRRVKESKAFGKRMMREQLTYYFLSNVNEWRGLR